MRLKESELSKRVQKEIEPVLIKEEQEPTLENTKEEFDIYTNSNTVPSHTSLINDLVKEVQVFSDDEEFYAEKKGGKKWIVILVLLLFLVGGIVAFLYVNKDKKETSKVEESPVEKTHNYRYEEQETKIVFYDNDIEMDSYLCEEECSIYSYGRYQYDSKEDHIIALQDGTDIFLYNYVEKKEITEHYQELKNLFHNENTVAFIAIDSLGKAGIIDTKGNILIPFEYDDFGYAFDGGEVTDYSYENNLITASKDSKWGLISLDKGEEKVPFGYEDIYYNGYDYVAAYKEGLWYLLDLEGNPVFEEGYDMMIPLNSYVFVSKNQNFMILNDKEEKVIQKDIPTYISGFRGRTTSVVPTFKIEVDGTIVTIYIMKSTESLTDYTTYKFNTVNGELTEVIS